MVGRFVSFVNTTKMLMPRPNTGQTVNEKNGRILVIRVWSGVTGICRFCDGSCRACGCGAYMWVKVFTHALGWFTIHERDEPVPKDSSLDAEIWGCGVVIGRKEKCVGKCSIYWVFSHA